MKEVLKIQPVIALQNNSFHDASVAALLSDGTIEALAAERVDGIKHSLDIDAVLRFIVRRHLQDGRLGVIPNYLIHPKFNYKRSVNKHHFHHACSTFFASGMDKSLVVVIDGQGFEYDNILYSTSVWHGDVNNGLKLIEAPFATVGNFNPFSIGHFYSVIAVLAGFDELHSEGKLMGLSAYGIHSKYNQIIKKYVHSTQDGTFHINPLFILGVLGNTLGKRIYNWEILNDLANYIYYDFMSLKRESGQCHLLSHLDNANIASAGQSIIEEIVISYLIKLREYTNLNNLCLAGGVFLNSVLNFKIVQECGFDKVYVAPFASDDGIALGKLYHYIWRNKLPINTKLSSPYLGPVYSHNEINAAINKFKDRITIIKSNRYKSLLYAARALNNGKVIALYQGRSEFGPRALGNRSILADPRNVKMRSHVNKMIKHREWFRPLAPVVAEEDFGKYFFRGNLTDSPYMTFAVPVLHNQRKVLGAVSHIDGTARVQTVNYKQNPNLYLLLRMFKKVSGVSVLLNTSFNDNGQPIVETPEDAIVSFLSMKIDYLFLENYLISKKGFE